MENSPSIKILAVDDDSFMRQLIARCLPEPDFIVTLCPNAMEAMTVFKEKQFDFLILDIMMPGISGLQLRSLIRQENATIPIMLLTAKVDDAEGSLLKEISSDKNTYYQNKKFTKSELQSLIKSIMGRMWQAKQEKDYFKEMENDISLAGEIQKHMFPHWWSLDGGIQFCHYFRPYMKITGDMITHFKLEDGVFLEIIGDISGHGIQSALTMSAVENSISNYIRKTLLSDIQPHHILNHLQAFMEDISTEKYMTCLVAIVDFNVNMMTYQLAGHQAPIIFSPSQNKTVPAKDFKNGSIPVGLLKGTVYNESDTGTIQLPDDAIIFLYTDGLGDIQDDAGEDAGEELLQQLVSSISHEGLCPSTNFKIMDIYFKAGYTNIGDDITLAAISRHTLRPHNYDFSVSPSVYEIDQFVQKANNLVLEHTHDEILAGKVEILFSEFLNNIAVHGLGRRNAKRPIISVHIEFLEENMMITVCDQGKAWDMQLGETSNTQTENFFSDLKNRRLEFHGRGLHLLKSISKSITRSRYADMLNETIFLINYK